MVKVGLVTRADSALQFSSSRKKRRAEVGERVSSSKTKLYMATNMEIWFSQCGVVFIH